MRPTLSSSSDDSISSAAEAAADSSLTQKSPEKTKTQIVVTTPERPEGPKKDAEGFTENQTKGQKKAARLRRQAMERAGSHQKPQLPKPQTKNTKQSQASKRHKAF